MLTREVFEEEFDLLLSGRKKSIRIVHIEEYFVNSDILAKIHTNVKLEISEIEKKTNQATGRKLLSKVTYLDQSGYDCVVSLEITSSENI